MKTTLLPFSFILFFSGTISAQLFAGEVSGGASAVEVDIDLQLPASNTSDMIGLEVDCDDQPDMMAVLIHGQPIVDAPNIATLNILYDDLEVCMDMAAFPRPQYYTYGQPLTCTGAYAWQGDSVNVLGDFGGFTAIGPTNIDSMYIAYRRDMQVGWMLLSFDVNGGVAPVRLQIHQVLPICPAFTSIASYDLSSGMSLFPNPTDGQMIRVESADALRSIEVLDAAGRSVEQFGGTTRTIPAPEVAGTYLVRMIDAEGHRSTTRLVRY